MGSEIDPAVKDVAQHVVDTPSTDPNASKSTTTTKTSLLSKCIPKRFRKSPKSVEKEEETELKKEKKPSVSYAALYRYATVGDLALLALGYIAAMANGACLPILTLVWGDVINYFLFSASLGPDEFLRLVSIECLKFFGIGIGAFTASAIQHFCFVVTGERQTKRIREEYFKAVLRQEIAFFDDEKSTGVATKINADVLLIQDAISEKVGLIAQQLACFITGFVIAFVKGPKLAGVLIACIPVISIVFFVSAKFLVNSSEQTQGAYSYADAVATEVFNAIKTIVGFGAEEKTISRYEKFLDVALIGGLKKGWTNGISLGLTNLIIYCTYALGFYYGGVLIGSNEMDPGSVLTSFFSVLIAAFSLSYCGPFYQYLPIGCGAAYEIYQIIDKPPSIDSLSETGTKPSTCNGHIEFKNVSLRYPSRPDVQVLQNFNLVIEPGQNIALVGPSGSGKSSIVRLMERFYDCSEGDILFDRVPIRDLNVRWLRTQISLVSQEPTLFNTTIRQNLLYGIKEDYQSWTPEQIDNKCIEALKLANAWDFVSKLPQTLDTNVGQAGGQLSGGQKQRIAIARAVMSDPKILLLDESTSALDSASEKIVNAALERASKGRTTISIAHRLSTIRNADKIIVMDRGNVIETGTHSELINLKGVYAKLVEAQTLRMEESVGGKDEKTPENSAEFIGTGESSMVMEKRADGVHLNLGEELEKKTEKMKKVTDTEEDEEDQVDEAFLTKEDKEEREKKRMEAILKKRGFLWKRVFDFNRPEWPLMAMGTFLAAINSVIMPAFSLFFNLILTVFTKTGDELRDGTIFWACMFIVLGVVAFITIGGYYTLFLLSGERLTRRVRAQTFRHLIYQEVAFFDHPANASGVLTARLASDATQLKNLTGDLAGAIIGAAGSFIAGIIIAGVAGWQLMLVGLAAFPLTALAALMEMKFIGGFGRKTRSLYNKIAQNASEVITNIRTVASLTQETYFINRYLEDIHVPHMISLKSSVSSSAIYGFSQCMTYFILSLCFYVGAIFVNEGYMSEEDTRVVIFSILFSGMSVAQALTYIPNLTKAKLSALSVFDILDRPSRINSASKEGFVPVNETRGKADFEKIEFRYPTRQDMPILKGLDLLVQPGQTIGLVGHSGCGKSTLISLLIRFYDADNGRVALDDTNVTDWNVASLRNQMALVSQEPVLFDLSIEENIRFGSGKKGDEITMEEIEAVARLANIHEFIVSLPEGYKTRIGVAGSQLSGGQKQRIAIARALIRSPKVLLLDEATAALDGTSEKVVQEALDKASSGRTTLVIAHRLATVQNADAIVVVQDGKVAEVGKHEELLGKKGLYFELVTQQGLGVEEK